MRRAPPKALIFDMDGLMIDSEPLQSAAFESVLRQLGCVPQLSPGELLHELGLTAQENWERLHSRYRLVSPVSELVSKWSELVAISA